MSEKLYVISQTDLQNLLRSAGNGKVNDFQEIPEWAVCFTTRPHYIDGPVFAMWVYKVEDIKR